MLPELERMPRLELASTPTALQEAPRLAHELGLDRLLIKRDDNTGLALGGNKARKLEYLVADAVAGGTDVLITIGGPQSNHCRATAAAARVAGLDAQLVFAGPAVEAVQGNMVLDQLLGATWTFPPPGQSAAERMAELAAELRAAGRRPYVIPSGGSNGIGALGYVRGALELVGQFAERGLRPRYVVCAAGSCGTLAGLTLGLALAGSEAQVVGVSVSTSIPDRVARTREVMAESCSHLGIDLPGAAPVIWDQYVGAGYGMPTDLSRRALEVTARTEGLILDPVYTAKAFGGLIGEVEAGRVRSDDLVVFIHRRDAGTLRRPRSVLAAGLRGRLVNRCNGLMSRHIGALWRLHRSDVPAHSGALQRKGGGPGWLRTSDQPIMSRPL
jgi:D-cysteine desulfhydrase family pyridoxal phosphate-dependent enzyme